MFKLAVSLVIVLVVLWVGVYVLKLLARPQPAPPPPGEMRRVNLRYRCTVCGMELRMTAAPDEEPEAPRHCLEDMDLLPPLE